MDNLKKAIEEALTDEKVLKKISELVKSTVGSEMRPILTTVDNLEYRVSHFHDIISVLCFKHAICPRCGGRLKLELKTLREGSYGYAFKCTRCGMEGWISKDEVGVIER